MQIFFYKLFTINYKQKGVNKSVSSIYNSMSELGDNDLNPCYIRDYK